MNKADRDKVIAALKDGRDALYSDAQSYHASMAGYRPLVHERKDQEVKEADEALTIMRGLAEDAEPRIDYAVIHEFASNNRLNYNQLCNLVRSAIALIRFPTSPQAAQTATVGPYDLKCKDVIDYPFQAAQTDEREAFEAWPRACREIIDRWVAPDMYKYAVAMLDLAIQADQARRAGRKE